MGDWSTSRTSSSNSGPGQPRPPPTSSPRWDLARVAAVQAGLQLAVEHVVHQGALARARHAGDGGRACRAECRRPRPRGCGASRRGPGASGGPAGRRALGTPMRFCAGEVLAGQRVRARSRLRAGVDDLPPRSPAPGPSSSMKSAWRMAARSCSTTRTVLPASRRRRSSAEQPVGVARVEADRRLVQDVERVHQPGAERVGEGDALGLAAGEGAGLAVEGEIAEADVAQEAQPGLELLQNQLRHLPLDRR